MGINYPGPEILLSSFSIKFLTKSTRNLPRGVTYLNRQWLTRSQRRSTVSPMSELIPIAWSCASCIVVHTGRFTSLPLSHLIIQL